MGNTQSVLLVKFNSTHSPEALAEICNMDLDNFKKVPGLVQKYYITEELTGALSGVYIFADKNAKEAFWASDLAKSIPARYGVKVETLRVENFDMLLVMNKN